MNEQKYKDWVLQLTKLSSEQLNDLSNRIKLLSFASEKTFDGKADFGVRATEAICKVLRGRGTECPSPNTLRKSQAYVSSRNKFDDLAAFFNKMSSQRLVQDAILVEAIGLLYDDLLQWQGIAISSHTLLQQCHRLPATLNKAFPGYAASGLLSKIVKVA